MIFLARDLTGLDPNGRPCEACGNSMHDSRHVWVSLDIHGFVTYCAIKCEPDEKPIGEAVANLSLEGYKAYKLLTTEDEKNLLEEA